MFHDAVLVKLYHKSFNMTFLVMSCGAVILYLADTFEMLDCEKVI